MDGLGMVPGGDVAELYRCVGGDGSEVVGLLHVDGDLGGARTQTDTVIRHMVLEGFGVERVPADGWAGRGWDEVFDEHEVDVVMAGNHPGGAGECIGFARRVIRRNPLIDVLLYGLEEIEARSPEDFSQYTAIQTHPDRMYGDAAVAMIQTHRKKWNDIIFLRGMVISQIVEVESSLNGALLAYFRMDRRRSGHFEELILENSMYSLEGKKQTLKRLTRMLGMEEEWSGMDKMLSDLQSGRNKLAHCEVDPDDINRITSMGKTYHYDRATMRGMLRKARGARQRLERISSILSGMAG